MKKWLTPGVLILVLTSIFNIIFIRTRTPDSWQGVWPQITVIPQIAIPVFGAVWAAYTAHIISLRRSLPFTHASLARPPLLYHARSLLFFTALTFVPYLCGLAYCIIASPNFGAGTIWFSYVYVTVLEALSSIALGYLIGSLASGWFAPALSFLLTFMWLSVPIDFTRTPLSPTSAYPDVELNPVKLLLVSALVLFIVVATLLVAVWHPAVKTGWVRARRLITPVAVVTVAAIGVVVGMHFAGSYYQARTLTTAPTCTTSTVTVCVWPENSHRLPSVLPFAERTGSLADFGFEVPRTFTEAGLPGADDADATFALKGGLSWFYTSEWVASIVPSPNLDGDDAAVQRRYDARDLVQEWMNRYIHDGAESPVHGGPITEEGKQIVDEIIKQPVEDQRRWVREQLAVVTQ